MTEISFDSISAIQDYYGKVLKSTQDLKTSACCAADAPKEHIKEALKKVHPEVLSRFYGCGSPLPYVLNGLKVLDLGSGSGRDCFVLSALVGPHGSVTGVDMTGEQVGIARQYIEYHQKKYSYSKSNVEFKEAYIEDLESAGIASNSIDLVVSNCVFNLSPAKERVFREVWRVLKPGGELYFSDVFANRRIDPNLQRDPVLLGECLSGAMYKEDFRRILLSLGCADFRIVEQAPIAIEDSVIRAKLAGIEFSSMTIRAFKLELEDKCEDYGQVLLYKGGITEAEHFFMLDDHHVFEKDRFYPVCSNTAAMISETRFRPFFEVLGDKKQHFGLFDCGPSNLTTPKSTNGSNQSGACC
jgi:arsenite methyltransferase